MSASDRPSSDRTSTHWPCPPGTVCAANPDLWRDGLCEPCLSRHASVPGSCPPEALTRAGWEELFAGELAPVPPRPAPVEIAQRVIPTILAQVRRYAIPERFPELDTWAVPVHKVMNLRGRFRSRDLKDYLGLPADRRLILSTAAPDPYMEMLWEKRRELDFASRGIDYWFPAHFSIYDDDGKCFHVYNARRQQIHAIETGSRFAWFRIGETLPASFLEPIRQVPWVLLACQQMHSRRNQEILRREVEVADAWFPQSAVFFFVGWPRGGLERLERHCHWFDFRWLMLGVNGRNHRNEPEPELSIEEVLVRNLQHACSLHPTGDSC